ncbi:MAG: TSUP family transporter, partial [Deltaproteobacteria bacterium]
MDLSLPTLALLVVASFVAGTVDAIAGGGGLLTLPALLAAGLPPGLALGTNKGQSVFGSGAALLRFARAGLVDGRVARVT